MILILIVYNMKIYPFIPSFNINEFYYEIL